MGSRAFTRDEVILALDVLYSNEKEKVSAESDEMADLSALLNRLPIYSAEKRRDDYRSAHGVATQIYRFQRALATGVNKNNVGPLFFDINLEFENRHGELHKIAQAIRRNEQYYAIEYGSNAEDIGFPEGTLLGHLHRIIETRDGNKVSLSDRCEICDMKPELYYQTSETLLEQHLLVEPTELYGKGDYGADKFITVCPTCHAALHRLRPWRTKENCKEIMK